MKHYGDITKLSGYDLPIVDIVTGGSPCQDLSIAGKRAGLAGERSGLFMEMIRIIKEMRDNDIKTNNHTGADIRCRWMVWENVPGSFSSNKGADFQAVLEETAKVAEGDACIPGPPNGKWPHAGCIVGNGWSIAYRVHDAQFWGVPQRRKRIALVADFGGFTAPEILFERKGVSGDITESGKEGKGIAENAERSAGETGRCLNGWDVQSKHIQPENGRAEALYSGECRHGGGESYVMQSRAISFQERAGKPGGGKGILIQDEHIGALSTLNNQKVCYGFEPGAAQRLNPESRFSEEKSQTLREHMGDNQAAVVYGISGYESNAMKSSNPHSGIYEAETSRTLDLNGGSPACNQGGMVVLEGNGSRPSHKGDGYAESETMYTLNSTERHGVCCLNDQGGSQMSVSEDVSGTLRAQEHGHQPCVVEKKVYDWHRQDTRMTDCSDVCVTAIAAWGSGGNNMPMVMEPMAIGNEQADQTKLHEKVGALNCMHDQQAVMTYQEHTETVDACIGKGTSNQLAHNDMFVANTSVVRRLTPLECERLQGFPNGWTDIGDWIDSKGKKHKGEADSPRYKALGNSIALPFWRWMAKRMMKWCKSEHPTMGSLFDGIGGFPLSYMEAGCEPVWASEIEEFPIAVTKIRFPE